MGLGSKLKKLTADAKAELLARARATTDSWANALTGLGTARDKTTYTRPYLEPVLSPMELEALYHGDDIAARIVSAVPDEVYREGFVVVNKRAQAEVNELLKKKPGLTNADIMRAGQQAMLKQSDSVQERATELQKDLDNHGTCTKFRESHTWGRLYGLGAIFVGLDDGGAPWEPVDPDSVRGVEFLTVLDKRDLTPWRWYADPEAPKFSDVAVYLLQPVGVYVGAPYDIVNTNQVLLVHESRLIRFGGELTSKRLKLANQGADYSVLQKCMRALQLTNDNWQSAAALLADASQGVFTIRGLIDMIAGDSEIMTERFAFLDMVRSTFRAIVLDAGDQSNDAETFTRVPTPFTGIPEMLQQTWVRLASAARMPLTVLAGMSPAGLNATGESDMRWWGDNIKSQQTQAALPQLERLLRFFAVSKGWDDVDDWSVIFPPLTRLNALEEAQMHAAQATADNVYATQGWVTPEEGALSRFGGGKYSLDTKVDVESRKRSMAATLATMETEAGNAQEAAEDPAPTPGVVAAQEKASAETPDPGPPRTSET